MNPWEQMAAETAEAFEAFIAYRDLPISERRVSTVAAELEKSTQLLYRWCAQWKWKDRCKAWDDEKLKVADEATLQAIRETSKAIHETATQLRNKIVEALLGKDFTVLPAAELVEMYDIINKNDRAALGSDASGKGVAGAGLKGGALHFKVYQGVDPSQI